jgi:hypothetical protein
MKVSAVTQEDRPEQDQESAFQRFAKTMRALIVVPKAELEQKLAEDRQKREGRRYAHRT